MVPGDTNYGKAGIKNKKTGKPKTEQSRQSKFKKIEMNKINLLIALSISLGIASCNNASEKKATAETKDTATFNANEPAATGPTLPMDVVTIYHTVKDYNQWRAGFDADSVARNASGFSFVAVERSADKPNDVKIVLAPSDMAKAKAFIADPRLKNVMDKLGVISKPKINFWSIIRFNEEKRVPGGALIEINLKAKDFDAWLKGFDGEGIARRAADGWEDIAMGRGKDDPNMVHLVFGVTDMAKLKVRLADPELKKIMEEAGVVGAPAITFYNDASK